MARATVQNADGGSHQRDIVIHPGAVAILPIVEGDIICLVRNHRLAVGKTLLEIPAGTLEANENPDDAAKRELAEETGYRAANWQKLSSFYPSPGCLSEVTHLYVAHQLTPGEMNLQSDEDLEPCLLPWHELQQKVLEGAIQDAKTIIAVLLWAAKR